MAYLFFLTIYVILFVWRYMIFCGGVQTRSVVKYHSKKYCFLVWLSWFMHIYFSFFNQWFHVPSLWGNYFCILNQWWLYIVLFFFFLLYIYIVSWILYSNIKPLHLFCSEKPWMKKLNWRRSRRNSRYLGLLNSCTGINPINLISSQLDTWTPFLLQAELRAMREAAQWRRLQG